MTEIVVDVQNIQTIPDESCKDKLRFYVNIYKSHLIFLFIVCVISGIVIFAVSNKSSVNLPCSSYSTNSLASSVSISCIEYIWSKECPTETYKFQDGYSGWWNSSPQGTVMVKCVNGNRSSQCGIGSYGNLLVYMQFCNIAFGQ